MLIEPVLRPLVHKIVVLTPRLLFSRLLPLLMIKSIKIGTLLVVLRVLVSTGRKPWTDAIALTSRLLILVPSRVHVRLCETFWTL